MHSHLAVSKHRMRVSLLESAGNDVGRARIVARCFRMAVPGIVQSSEGDLLDGVFDEDFGQ